jgi:ATP adenylyltransferase
MDRLWSPWRYQYVSRATAADECIFCGIPAESNDSGNFVLYRGRGNFALLNLYPYTSGHLMVAPYAHVPRLGDLDAETLCEMILLVQRAERALAAVYRPEGLNVGMNLGECAGAGIAGHVHMHVLPRWRGDTNFMTAIGETRVMPESLESTYGKLLAAFRDE